MTDQYLKLNKELPERRMARRSGVCVNICKKCGGCKIMVVTRQNKLGETQGWVSRMTIPTLHM